jgi:hypothetical protein
VKLIFIGNIYINIRVLLATCVIAIKYNEDDYYSNEYYAKVGGIALQELNMLEYECVKMLDHRLFIDEEIFEKYEIYLKQYDN